MYFVYATEPYKTLPYHYQINGNYLSTAVDLDKNNLYGYKIGEHGGNFVEFLENSIRFAYHKDFKLITNTDFLLTNLEVEGTELANDIIEYFYDGNIKHYQYDEITDSNYSTVVEHFKMLLLNNIKSLTNDDARIVYTAGLDSGLIAYLAHAYNLNFTTIIHKKYIFKNLPFKKIEYHSATKLPDFKITYGPTHNVKFGFYQNFNTNLITGYYGDLCGLHHHQMYHQSKHLLTSNKNHVLYDKTVPGDYQPFNNKEEIVACIKYLNGQQYFRHWFDDFQILDPYRDPKLFEILLNLPLEQLIIQLGTGQIQKDIVKSLDPEWLNNLCDFKNDYEKFI